MWKFYSLAVAVLLSACGPGMRSGSNQPSPAGSAGGGKFDIEATMRREIGPLSRQKFASDVVSGDVEAAGKPEVARNSGSLKVTIPIGTQAPVECYVYHDR